MTNRVYARKCTITELADGEYKEFVNNNHMQGYKSANVMISLVHDDSVVCVASFSRYKDGWELVRLASILGMTIVGGVSKLIKQFIRKVNPSYLISYADLRYSCGNVYESLGFEKLYETKPNYVYIKGRVVYSRQKFQKHKLKLKLDTFDNNLTEAENMFANGYRRMWDAGHAKYLLKIL